jgi:hypothetical protein
MLANTAELSFACTLLAVAHLHPVLAKTIELTVFGYALHPDMLTKSAAFTSAPTIMTITPRPAMPTNAAVRITRRLCNINSRLRRHDKRLDSIGTFFAARSSCN